MFYNNILFYFINKTPLCLAIEEKNVEIAKLLLSCKGIDVNIRSI